MGSSRMLPSDFKRIPVEIIAMIFTYCLPTDVYITPHRNEAPLLLTHVCAEWRRLAIAMPLLWSSLSVKVWPTHTEPALPLVYLWLDRSASCPLSLSLAHDDRGEWENDGSESASLILDLFFALWHRWRNFCLIFPDPCPGYAVTNLPDAGPPLLESLTILIGDGLCAEEIDGAAALYTSAPKLSEFTWGWSYYDIDYRTVPWAQLSCLRLECDIPMSAALNVIKLCSNLVTMHLGGVYHNAVDRERVEHTASHITHPNLRYICVTSLQSADLYTTSSLFRQLTLPQLSYLSLSEVQLLPVRARSIPPNVHAELSLFFLRSKCPLQTLRVDSVANILQLTLDAVTIVHKTLVSLEIHDQRHINADPLVSLLTLRSKPSVSSPTAIFCPRIDLLKFGGNVEAHPRLIGSLMLSRWFVHRAGIPTLQFQSEWPISTGFVRERISADQR